MNMGRVICVAGSHAVGKTTLFNKIKNECLDIDVIDGYIIEKDNLDLSKENDYVQYELKYIKRLNEDYDSIKKGTKDTVVIRSFEDTVYYLEHQDSVKSSWNLEEVRKSINRKSDLIIFLDAPIDVLKRRANNDKARDIAVTFDWYEHWHESYVSFWKSIPNCMIVDTTILKSDEVFDKVMSLIRGE